MRSKASSRHTLRPVRVALTLFLIPVLADVAAALPMYLYGVEGDDDTMVRVDLNSPTPTAELLGTVVYNGAPVLEMEALTWDRDLGRLIVVSNAGAGPVFRINPTDITAPPPADIPAAYVGDTQTIQMEGIALQPVENVYYGADNTTHPGLLVKIDRFNGTVTQVIGELEAADGTDYDNMEALAFTFDTPHVLYGANNPGEGLSQLVTINTLTGEVTPVGPGIGFVNVECLAFAPNGTLYGFSNGNAASDWFIVIDPITGIGTELSVVDADQYDIEGCALIEPNTNVSVQSSNWSGVKRLYAMP